MKRSEMIKVIEKSIWRKLKGSVEPGPGMAELIAKHVLTEIEKAGMVPPIMPYGHDWERENEK